MSLIMYGGGGSSDVIATDFDGEFPKMKDFVSSNYKNLEHNHNQSQNQNHVQSHIQNQHQQSDVVRQTESSLMRYRSAPSSFFADLLDGCDDFLAPIVDTSSNPEFSQHHQQQQQQQQQQLQQQQQIPHLQPSNDNGIYDHTNHNNLESSSRFRSMNSTSSNLIRQSSSPAGFLSSLNSESGFAGIDGAKTNSSNRMINNISFSPGPSSSSMLLPQIPENQNQINDSTFKSLKRTRDGDAITLDRQDGLSRHYTPTLVHHLSLPNTSSEKAVAVKILRFERDLVSTNSRAKRGCATHPRSIAERVRRTRISERMKKLQELFPNMEKQTSTADMLDTAVQYIKDLQKDLQILKDARSKCACSSKQ